MTKRKSTGAGHEGGDDKAAANKKIKVADEDNITAAGDDDKAVATDGDKAAAPDNDKTVAGDGNDTAAAVADEKKGLMDFPAELRNAVWDFALDDLRAAPSEEWDFFETDFSTFSSLMLVNKPVRCEVTGVFNVIAEDMTIYTDNVPKVYDALKASQTKYPALASAFFKICTPTNDGDDPYYDNPHWFGVDAMIAFQQAESNRDHHDYTPYDITNLDATYGLDRWYWLPCAKSPGSSGCCGDAKTIYGFFGPDVTEGVTYEKYLKDKGKEKWRRAVIQGCFEDIVMDTRDNINAMRAHVADVERYKREHPEEFERDQREYSDSEED